MSQDPIIPGESPANSLSEPTVPSTPPPLVVPMTGHTLSGVPGSTPHLPTPSPDLQDLLETLTWDRGTVPFDLARDADSAVVRSVASANPAILDLIYAWLGPDLLTDLLNRLAPQIPWLGMTMTVYRFDLPKDLCDRADRHTNDWLGQEDPNAGIQFLQANWQPA